MLHSNIEGIVDISDPPEDFRTWDDLYTKESNIDEKDVDDLRIYTSYYGNVRNLHDCVLISISRSTPIIVDHYFPELAPSWTLLNKYKSSGDTKEYTKEYIEEILGKTSPGEIIGQVRRILSMTRSKKAVFLCFEKRGDFCHRHIVSNWLKEAGYIIEEI